MEIESFEDLTQRHPTTAVFWPFPTSIPDGDPAEASLRWIQESVAPYDLDGWVPEAVRTYLEGARRLHVYGYFEYSFFTVASERAMLAAEFAVRLRFLERHNGQVSIERRKAGSIESRILQPADTWAFASEFQRLHHKKWRLVGHPSFNGSLGAHLAWASATIDLGPYFPRGGHTPGGTGVRGRLDVLRELRNAAAHPSMDLVVSPIDSRRSIEFSWRFINALWGVTAPD